LMSVSGLPDGVPGAGPMKTGIPVSDLFTGLYATIGILAALQHRERSGQGQHVDCALLDSQVALLANQGMNYLVGGAVPKRLGNAHPNVVPYRDFETADGYILVACGTDGQFQALCSVLGRNDLSGDARFASNGGRQANRDELEAELRTSILTWTSQAILAALDGAGVPSGPINRIDEILADPQIKARELLQSMRRDDGTNIDVIGFPVKLSRTPATYRAAPPRHAQHTQAVLRELLGLDVDALARLCADGVIAMDGGCHS